MTEDGPKKFGEMLRAKRSEACLSQRKLAKKTGVAHTLISNLENGIRSAGRKVAGKLAVGLALSENEKICFFELAETTSRRTRIAVGETNVRATKNQKLWIRLIESLLPDWEIREIQFSSSGSYDLVITLKDHCLRGVIFFSGTILVVWNPALDGGLADLQRFRDILDDLSGMEMDDQRCRELIGRGRSVGFEILIFGMRKV